MVERRPLLTATAHFVLMLGVAIVAFPVLVTFIGSTQTTEQIASSNPLSLWPGNNLGESYRLALFGGKASSGSTVAPILPMLWVSLALVTKIAPRKLAATAVGIYYLSFFLANQYGAFNSPVWFNCGLFSRYGIGGSGGNFAVEWDYLKGSRKVDARSHEKPATAPLVVGREQGYVGVLVDEVLGQRNFTDENIPVDNPTLDERYARFVSRNYELGNTTWSIFSMTTLVRSPDFLQASA